MTSVRCPSPIELERAYWSSDGTVGEHARGCARCESAWEEIARLSAMADALAPAPVSDDRREELRATLLSKVQQPVVSARERRWSWRWQWALVPLAAGAAAMALWLVWPGATSSKVTVATGAGENVERRSAILDHDGARMLVASLQPDEIVRLVDGEISVRVDRLRDGERFRVIAGDGEVEARGGSFDVVTRGDSLVRVRVVQGSVVVRASGEERTIAEGETWVLEKTADADADADADAAAAAAAGAGAGAGADAAAGVPVAAIRRPTPKPVPEPVAEAVAVPEPEPEAVAEPEPVARTAAQQAFDDAWRAMRADDFAGAAAAFERVMLSPDPGPLAEDARFWRAAALARAGRSRDAIAAFEIFLDRHPRAIRAGEASAALGWLLLDRGDLDDAATRFTAAVGDRSPRVRESAARGLRAVGATGAK